MSGASSKQVDEDPRSRCWLRLNTRLGDCGNKKTLGHYMNGSNGRLEGPDL